MEIPLIQWINFYCDQDIQKFFHFILLSWTASSLWIICKFIPRKFFELNSKMVLLLKKIFQGYNWLMTDLSGKLHKYINSWGKVIFFPFLMKFLYAK